ncbi:PspA/IM30 family protein [bacterium]|nr:PspA/IM30 family protein [candidate division CSSED10-310 bacterium]
MFRRIRRLIRGFFGLWIEKMEDPVLILKQNIRDLNDQVPRMNEHIAMVKANVTLLENEATRLNEKSRVLQIKIKAALKAGRRDIALNYATSLEEIKEALQSNAQQHQIAEQAFQHALKVKQAFMREKELKTREAMQAIRDVERAKWQREIADVFETFTVTGINQTHDEMVARAQEQTAKDHARLELALHAAGEEEIQFEEEVKQLEANEIVAQYERDLGIAPDEPESPAPQAETG